MSSEQKEHQAPPPYGFQSAPMTHQPAVVVASTEPVVNFGPSSQACICPYCHANIISNVKSEPTTKTHLIALLLFCCICWPCVCLPYCMDSCQSTNHYCPNCSAYLGRYEN